MIDNERGEIERKRDRNKKTFAVGHIRTRYTE